MRGIIVGRARVADERASHNVSLFGELGRCRVAPFVDQAAPRCTPARKGSTPIEENGSKWAVTRGSTHRGRRGTRCGTNALEILRFWVQWWHWRVASVQVADTKPGSMPLVMRRSGPTQFRERRRGEVPCQWQGQRIDTRANR